MKQEITIVEILINIKGRMSSYIDKPTPKKLKSFLDGLKLGYFLAKNQINSNYFIDYWIDSVESHGWQVNTVNFNKQMREKEMSDHEIMQELLDIEIDAWSNMIKKELEV